MSSKKTTSDSSTLLIVLIVIITFPFWIAIGGVIIGVIGAIFGVTFGLLGALLGGIFALITLPFKLLFGWGDWSCNISRISQQWICMARAADFCRAADQQEKQIELKLQRFAHGLKMIFQGILPGDVCIPAFAQKDISVFNVLYIEFINRFISWYGFYIGLTVYKIDCA